MSYGFGLASVKAEGTTDWYDFEGINRQDWVDEYLKLDRKWFKTKKRLRRMDYLMGTLVKYDLEVLKRNESS